MLALVHGETASSATEAVALRAKLAAVADFAVQLALVLGAVCRVEHFTAKTCNTRSLPAVGDYDASILLRLLGGGRGGCRYSARRILTCLLGDEWLNRNRDSLAFSRGLLSGSLDTREFLALRKAEGSETKLGLWFSDFL